MNFAQIPDLQPTLIGDTVVIRPIRPSDWNEMFAAASDPLIWEGHPVSTRHTERVFRHFFDGAVASGSGFSIVEKATGEIIGSSRYYKYDAEQRAITIGYTFLIRRHWGGKTNGEVKRLMVSHAFGFVDIVRFEVGETNERSRRAMMKIGASLRNEIVERSVSGVTYRDVVFEIARPGVR